MLTPSEVIFSIQQSLNKKNQNKIDFNLKCHFKDSDINWTLYTWDFMPDVEEINDIKSIVLKSFKFYHANLKIPEFNLEDNLLQDTLDIATSLSDQIEKMPTNFHGWNVRKEKDGRCQIYKYIDHKKKGIYIGKIWDENIALTKIALFENPKDSNIRVGDTVRVKNSLNLYEANKTGLIKKKYKNDTFLIDFVDVSRIYAGKNIEKVFDTDILPEPVVPAPVILKQTFQLDNKVRFSAPGYATSGKVGIVLYKLNDDLYTIDFGENGGLVNCSPDMLSNLPVYTHPTFEIDDEVLFTEKGYDITDKIGKITEQNSENNFKIYFGKDLGYFDCDDTEFVKKINTVAIKKQKSKVVPSHFQGCQVVRKIVNKCGYLYLRKSFEGKSKFLYIGKEWDEDKAVQALKNYSQNIKRYKRFPLVIVNNKNLKTYGLFGEVLSYYDEIYEIKFPDYIDLVEEKDVRKPRHRDSHYNNGDVVRVREGYPNSDVYGIVYSHTNQTMFKIDFGDFIKVYNRNEIHKIMNKEDYLYLKSLK